MKRYKIYVLVDPYTEHVRYVGLTMRSLHQRLNGHISSSRKLKESKQSKNTHKINWINGLLEKESRPIIKQIESNLSREEACEREQYWIQYYKEKGFKITNATSGGEGIRDYSHTEETRAKLKKSLTGRKLSETHRENIGKSSIGRYLSEESRDKLADKVKQEWLNNPERLAEMKARIGENNPNWGGKFPGVIIFDKEGTIIGDFKHLQEASELTGLTKTFIRACVLGKKKSAKYNIEMK